MPNDPNESREAGEQIIARPKRLLDPEEKAMNEDPVDKRGRKRGILFQGDHTTRIWLLR